MVDVVLLSVMSRRVGIAVLLVAVTGCSGRSEEDARLLSRLRLLLFLFEVTISLTRFISASTCSFGSSKGTDQIVFV